MDVGNWINGLDKRLEFTKMTTDFIRGRWVTDSNFLFFFLLYSDKANSNGYKKRKQI